MSPMPPSIYMKHVISKYTPEGTSDRDHAIIEQALRDTTRTGTLDHLPREAFEAFIAKVYREGIESYREAYANDPMVNRYAA